MSAALTALTMAGGYYTAGARYNPDDPTQLASDMTLSPIDGLMYGTLMAKQRNGFHSGGMLGMSTFFTGYNPSDGVGGFARSISLGRMAGAAIQTIAEIGAGAVAPGGTAYHVFNRFADFSNTGAFGAMTYRADGHSLGADLVNAMRNDRVDKVKTVTKLDPSTQSPTPLRRNNTNHRAGPRRAEPPKLTNSAQRLRSQARAASVPSGLGFDTENRLQAMLHRNADGSARLGYGERGKNSYGFGGAGGRMAGRLTQLGLGLELAKFAADKMVDFAGDAYQSAVTVTNRMRETYNLNGNRLSPVYMSAAATTERQRAMAELNSSILNPRTQLQGNEAVFFHK